MDVKPGTPFRVVQVDQQRTNGRIEAVIKDESDGGGMEFRVTIPILLALHWGVYEGRVMRVTCDEA